MRESRKEKVVGHKIHPLAVLSSKPLVHLDIDGSQLGVHTDEAPDFQVCNCIIIQVPIGPCAETRREVLRNIINRISLSAQPKPVHETNMKPSTTGALSKHNMCSSSPMPVRKAVRKNERMYPLVEHSIYIFEG